MSTKTDAAIERLTEWEATASDRDIQIQLLRVAIETRDKVETIHGSSPSCSCCGWWA